VQCKGSGTTEISIGQGTFENSQDTLPLAHINYAVQVAVVKVSLLYESMEATRLCLIQVPVDALNLLKEATTPRWFWVPWRSD
jgi:hypothetical protein